MNTARAPVKVFINYRRSESAGDARALFYRLVARFGNENVFFDVESLQPGTKWLEGVKQEASACGVFLALIGPRWTAIMEERARRRQVDPEEDYVRVELETALRKGSGVHVLPVLIDDAVMPSTESASPLLRRFAAYNALAVRHSRWEDDVEALVQHIDEMARERPVEPEPEVAPMPVVIAQPDGGAEHEHEAPRPPASHYAAVAEHLRQGTIVPFLGAGINAGDREGPWEDGCGLPDADELSNHLAQTFDVASREPAVLAQVSQDVYVGKGKTDLFRTLRRILTSNCQPNSVHRFLAKLPAALSDAGVTSRYQLIVTTNYDDALERAFDAEEEPYDVAVYMAAGDYQEHSGKFLHLPYDGPGGPILVPNKYVDFPIDEDGNLERTVIVKINGAVDRAHEPYPWRENYVITEDQFIDYLSRSPVESLIPFQILNKMRESHFLFLGYTMRDWNLRVFLQRMWGRQKLDKSWAIERRPEALERDRWNEFGVELFASPLAEYVAQLHAHVGMLGAARPRE